MICIDQIYRFPVKGLRGEPLDAVSLAVGQGIPHDRRFAIARGDTRIDGTAARPRGRSSTGSGGDIRVGDVTLRIPARIPCCAATGVCPEQGERDLNVVKGLRAAYGHYDMGVYGEVIRGDRVAVGDPVTPPDDSRPRSRMGHWLRFFGFLARSAPIVLRRR